MRKTQASHTLMTEQLWQFSLSYYAVMEVKEACLTLQNQFGGNVNTLLLLKYLDLHKLSINNDELETLIKATDNTDGLINHYRQLRQSLKPSLPDNLYQKTLKFELELEKRQQADLVDQFNTLNSKPTTTPNLVSTYCQRLNATHLSASFIEPS
ncbi:TIGR02444 family protein [Vibrio sp. WJH972]